MKRKIVPIVVAAFAAFSLLAAAYTSPSRAQNPAQQARDHANENAAFQHCVTADPDPDTQMTLAEQGRTKKAQMEASGQAVVLRPAGSVTVGVRFHIMIDPATNNGYIPQSAIDAQVAALNQDFSGAEAPSSSTTAGDTAFRFQWLSTTYHSNAAWYNASHGSTAEAQMKRAIRDADGNGVNDEGPNVLYFYTNNTGGGSTGGWATFPWDYAARPVMDGVVVLWKSLPGGSIGPSYNEGEIGSHEVGHWVGLYHTFQGDCRKPGDEVEDTPYEFITGARGCPEGSDTCKRQPGADPIHNYMDYTYNTCQWEFTKGQAARADEKCQVYRGL